nr:MAG TPA: hypothetical protein [Bacteriophage sp.]
MAEKERFELSHRLSQSTPLAGVQASSKIGVFCYLRVTCV